MCRIGRNIWVYKIFSLQQNFITDSTKKMGINFLHVLNNAKIR